MEFREYLAELKNVETLDFTEERILWQAAENGDSKARARLIRAYQPLVFKCALPFRQLDFVMDIVQEGTVGLIEAADGYDWRRGVAFSLYAVHRIRGRMLNFLAKEKKADLATLDAECAENGLSWREALPDAGAPIAEIVETREMVEQMLAALRRLPERERTVLSSLYLASSEAAEVASFLRLSTSHIYRLQKNGIRRIRGMLSRLMQK